MNRRELIEYTLQLGVYDAPEERTDQELRDAIAFEEMKLPEPDRRTGMTAEDWLTSRLAKLQDIYDTLQEDVLHALYNEKPYTANRYTWEAAGVARAIAVLRGIR